MLRRSIPELITRYRLHPELQDIYVEGETDRDLVTWALTELGLRDSRVYPASIIDVDPALLAKYNLTHGARSQIIVLAKELEDNIPADARAIGIVDRDYDAILGRKIESPFFRTTDYGSIELYTFEETTLGKFLSLVLGAPSVDPRTTLSNLTDPLKELALIKAARQVLALVCPLVDFRKYLRIDDDRVLFDRGRFIRNSLIAAALGKRETSLLAKIEELRPRLPADPRQYINGHDFIDILTWYFGKKKLFRGRGDGDYVFRSLLGCVEHRTLIEEPLFKALLTRLQPSG